jgi:hypothetical protein
MTRRTPPRGRSAARPPPTAPEKGGLSAKASLTVALAGIVATLIAAWATSRDGNGIVITDGAYPDAHELAEHGWLERRFEPDGEMSWWWTPAAETALDLNGLLQAAEGREN